MDAHSVKLEGKVSEENWIGSNYTYCAAITFLHEFFHPSHTIWIGRSGGSNKAIALIFQRLNVCLPKIRSVRRRHVGLVHFVRPRGIR